MMLRVIAATATPPRGALLAPGVALIMMSGPDRPDEALGISFRGRPLPAPYGMVTIETNPDALRIAAVRLPADQQGDLPLLVESHSGDHVPLYLSELDTDPLAIAAGLDNAARWRLLEFLLNFCCAAFRLGTTAPFSRLCVRLALDCTRHAGIATVEAQVLAGRVLLGGMDVPHGSTLCVLGETASHTAPPKYSKPAACKLFRRSPPATLSLPADPTQPVGRSMNRRSFRMFWLCRRVAGPKAHWPALPVARLSVAGRGQNPWFNCSATWTFSTRHRRGKSMTHRSRFAVKSNTRYLIMKAECFWRVGCETRLV